MVEPTGYTALDLIGFTDRGDYDPSAYYVKNDLVHDGVDNIWRVLIDDTHGVTPAEGLNYTIFIRNHGTEAEEIIAPVESNPAAAAHAVGTQLINDGDLYEVTTAIAVGDSLVAYPTSGYNIKAADSITGQLKSVKSGLGTAAAKNFTTSVTSGSGDLVTSGAVHSQIQTLANDVAYVNTNPTTASKGYSEGEQFILNGVLKVATANISSGATLSNSNCQDSDDIVTQIAEKVTIKKATVNAHSTYTYDLEDGVYMVASTGSFSSLLALSIGVGYGAGDTRNKLSAIIPASDGEIAFVAEPNYFGVRCANASDYPITFYLIQ